MKSGQFKGAVKLHFLNEGNGLCIYELKLNQVYCNND